MNHASYNRRTTAMRTPCCGQQTVQHRMPERMQEPLCCGGKSQAECDKMVLAMAYVLSQPFDEVYETEAGYRSGTIFPALDKPFLAGGNCCG